MLFFLFIALHSFFFLQNYNYAHLPNVPCYNSHISPSYKCKSKIHWPQAIGYTIVCMLLQKKLLSQMGIKVGVGG